MSESDNSWEEHSVDDDGSDSSDASTQFDDETEDVNVLEVRGAEPYRFEPVRAPDEAMDQAGTAASEDDADSNRLLNTDWCSCGHCVVQSLPQNSKCCKEIQEIVAKFTELEIDVDDAESCISEHEWFAACCLHPATLQTAHMQYQTQYGRNAVQGTLDQKYRHVAYRQVVRWCWGYLGRHNRVPLPSCVMDKIRQTYPNADGEYKGFRYPPLDLY